MPNNQAGGGQKPHLTRVVLIAALFLSGCSGNEAQPQLSLSAVLPNPAMPGETLSVIGNLPKNAKFTLDGVSIPASPTANGATLQLPESTLAGEHTLRVPGTTLAGGAVVVPRVDTAFLDGNLLTVRGAGWPATGSLANVSVDANGRLITPTLQDGQLRIILPPGTSYGALNLRVNVAGYSSSTFILLREAATVRGTVLLPASSEVEETQRLQAQATPGEADSATLIVRHAPGALNDVPLSGLLRHNVLPSLGLARLAFRSAAQAQHAKAQLSDLTAVQSVTFDALVRTDGVKTFGQATTSGLGKQWFWNLQGLPSAWEHTQGTGVTVAVIDTGVLLHHPDLTANLLPGYDFVDDDATPQDRVGHGTHVAGLIAANGQVTGAAPQARILPVRVLDADRGGSAFTVAQGVLWAAGLLEGHLNPNPAHIINLSLGTPDDSEALRQAVMKAQQAGVLVIAATGNSGGVLSYPAAYPGVLAVTSVAGPKSTYQPGYASKGPGTGLAAYGGDSQADQDSDGVRDGILSTDLTEGTPGYGLRMGTSMASPQVAGIAALALSSGVPRELLKNTLFNTATDLGPMGEDDKFGRGLVNARLAGSLNPRSYVVALNEANKVISWTPVARDSTFVLTNLDPAVPVRLVALSDANNNRLLGEAGELRSTPTRILTLPGGKITDLAPLSLEPTNGSSSLFLEP